MVTIQEAAAALAAPFDYDEPPREYEQQDELEAAATAYVEALTDLKQYQPQLNRLRALQRSSEQYLLNHIEHGDDTHFEQGAYVWFMVPETRRLPADEATMNRRMERYFTEQEKNWILESRSATRLETRVTTSMDDESMMEEDDIGGMAVPNNGYMYRDLGEAMFTFRKATFEARLVQREVTTARRIMRYHESRLLGLLRDYRMPIYVGNVQVFLGQRLMSPTVGTIQQYLIDLGMRPDRIALYMDLKRQPKLTRKVNSVRLFRNGVEQRNDVFGVYRR